MDPNFRTTGIGGQIGFGGGLPVGASRDFQYGSGSPVHEPVIHRTFGVGVDCGEHGRSRPGHGQRLHRAALAKREIRGYLPQGIFFGSRLSEGIEELFQVLLPRTSSPRIGLPHALGSPPQLSLKPTEAHLTNRSRWSENWGPPQHGRLVKSEDHRLRDEHRFRPLF